MKNKLNAPRFSFWLAVIPFLGLLSCGSDTSPPESWPPPVIHLEQKGATFRGLSQVDQTLESSAELKFLKQDGTEDPQLHRIDSSVRCEGIDSSQAFEQSFQSRSTLRVEEILPPQGFIQKQIRLCQLQFKAWSPKGSRVDYRSLRMAVDFQQPMRNLNLILPKALRNRRLLQLAAEQELEGAQLICPSQTMAVQDLSTHLLNLDTPPSQECLFIRRSSEGAFFSSVFSWHPAEPQLEWTLTLGLPQDHHLPVFRVTNQGSTAALFSSTAFRLPLRRRAIAAWASQSQDVPYLLALEGLETLPPSSTGPVFRLGPGKEGILRLKPRDPLCSFQNSFYGYQFGFFTEVPPTLEISSSPDAWDSPSSQSFSVLDEVIWSSTLFPRRVFWLSEVNEVLRHLPWSQTSTTQEVPCL